MYKTLGRETLAKLDMAVNEHIKDGYLPIGNMIFTGVLFVQPMLLISVKVNPDFKPGSAHTVSAGTVILPDIKSDVELREMMRDPRYWRDQDPAYIKVIEDGFKKLYGGK